MSSQAPTPRTTRNSRGLRASPRVSSADSRPDDSAHNSRCRRSSGTPTHTSFAFSLETATHTPTLARFTQIHPHSTQPLALEAISEERPQPTTPTPTARSAFSRPPVFPPPVSLPPATPCIRTPLPKSSPPLKHPRIAAIRGTPTSGTRRSPFLKTPARYTRYITRFIDLTPLRSPAATPKSPGSETALFKRRREQEGEDKFARELWIAIRNDHYMKRCWCGPPNIYNSRKEAEVATGHLRFYLVGSKKKKLRVLQKKDDHRWHCVCGNNEYHAAYKDLLNSNGKRSAERTEIDLIVQDQASRKAEGRQSVDRVVPTPIDPISDEVQPQKHWCFQAKTLSPPLPMWMQTYGILNRAVAILSGPLATLCSTLREQFRGDTYETLDTRRRDLASDTVVVKRLKRHPSVSRIEQYPSDKEDDGFDDLVWADDPTHHIGLDKLEIICAAFDAQYKVIKDGKVTCGSSIADIRKQTSDPRIYETSFSVYQYETYLYGPLSLEETDAERAKRWRVAVEYYKQGLELFGHLVAQIYGPNLLRHLKQEYAVLPRRLPVGNNDFRKDCMKLGRFLGFMRSLDCIHNTTFDQVLSQIIVDVDAIHKQEMPPSYVKAKQDPTESMPGCFPKDSPLVETPADEIDIEPLYDYRFPDPEPSDEEHELPGPGVYRMVQKPKGILKPPKERDPSPPSPKYVPTPERTRKLSFINPVSNFIPPAHIPTKLMTPLEEEQFLSAKLKAEVVRDEHSTRAFEALRTVSKPRDGPLQLEDKWSLEALERDDQEMGLTYHAQRYDGFLNDLHKDLEKRVEQDNNKRFKSSITRPPRRQMVQIPLPPLPTTPERRRRAAHLLENDSNSPAVSTPGTNPLLRQRAGEQRPKPIEKRGPRSLEEFFAEDDDDLAISTLKLEQLQIDRQIKEEFQTSVQREIEEKRKRKEEEARRERQRLLEEERRRKEEERRREQAARRQKEADEFAALTGLRQPARPLITALSDDWNTRVTSAARANPTTELVKTLEGQPLTRRDFEEKLLPPTAWLNDNVIIGSILHIADYVNKAAGATDQEPKCAAFTSYFWPRVLSHGPGGCGRLLRRAGVRKANLLDIDTVLIPICAQSHWTLAVIRPGKRTVAHIDSMRGGGGDEKVKAKLLELVRFILEDKFVESEWRAVDYEAPRQTNGWDCGVFTITNALCMAIGLNPKFSYTERELTLQRRRLAAMLLNEGFKGEFSLDGL
ncbi:hypothetical protein P885DRAFT_45229 [Corynascus similis CBS 632.67]